MRDTATLLYEWRQTRLNLQDDFSEKNLQTAMDFWKSLDYSRQGFDFDHPNVWPDSWEYITEEFYTNSGNGVGCFYTVHHAKPDSNPEVWLVHDMSMGDMYLVCYVDGYILNRLTGVLEKFDLIQNDLHVMNKYSASTIINAVKDRNSNG